MPPLQIITGGKEPIVGWRSWHAVQPGYLFTNATVWVPGERTEARCLGSGYDTHNAPEPECVCGIYATRTAAQLNQLDYAQRLFGEVWLWGRVVEHEDGYRAQYAYPKSLFLANTHHHVALIPSVAFYSYVAARFGCQLEVLPEMHTLFVESVEERAERERREEAARERARLRRLAEQQKKKLKQQLMCKAAAGLPATKPGFKNLLEQILADAGSKGWTDEA